MTVDDLVFLALALCWMGASVVAMQWWHEARSEWLARLSARGLLSGTYTPGPPNYGGTGAVRWMLRQRVALSDLADTRRLQREADSDRVTEVWRVRMVRRRRVLVLVGLGGLAVLAVTWGLYDIAGWPAFLIVVAALAVIGSLRARPLYRRLRAWGDYGST